MSELQNRIVERLAALDLLQQVDLTRTSGRSL